MNPNVGRHLMRHRALVGILIAAAAIAVLECVVFNLPFWTTLSASTDSSAAQNTLGAGLERLDDGLLKVTDPSQAYLELTADGSSSFVRIDTVTVATKGDGDRPLDPVKVRVDSDGRAGRVSSVSVHAPQSLYLRTSATHTVRVWIVQARDSLIPFSAVRSNVHVRFSLQWLRIAVMAGIALLVACLRPRSALWRITLDPSSTRQRVALAVALLGVAAVTIYNIATQMQYNWAMAFHESGNYTYDFKQYGYVADALLHGHTWLDLPVPQELAQASNPYDPAVRDRLLARGVSPIYWDYALHQGRWYSYFGVLPAVMLFLPYRLLSRLWVEGGQMLPAGVAVVVLMFGFAVFGSLMIIRLVHRLAPRTSVAATVIALAVFFLGSNAGYVWFRTNFYSVPFASSLLLSTLGLWLWLGAEIRERPTARRPTKDPHDPAPRVRGARRRLGVWSVDGVPPLSLPRLSAGALCLAANIGCRPTFALAALLGIPLFWRHIVALLRGIAAHTLQLRQAVRAPLAVLVPAMLVVMPIAAYNVARFGSPTDFGNDYQITVTNMVGYHEPAENMPAILAYYVALPLRFMSQFPYMTLAPTPTPTWSYAEPMVGGFLLFCPLMLLAIALPFLRRRLSASGCWGMAMTAMGLGLFLLVFDAYKAGLAWRYMVDFGWLFAMACIPVLLLVLPGERSAGDGARRPKTMVRASVVDTDMVGVGASVTASADTDDGRTPRLGWRMWWTRAAVLVLLGASVAVTVMSWFAPGRFDALNMANPGVFHTVQAWLLFWS